MSMNLVLWVKYDSGEKETCLQFSQCSSHATGGTVWPPLGLPCSESLMSLTSGGMLSPYPVLTNQISHPFNYTSVYENIHTCTFLQCRWMYHSIIPTSILLQFDTSTTMDFLMGNFVLCAEAWLIPHTLTPPTFLMPNTSHPHILLFMSLTPGSPYLD